MKKKNRHIKLQIKASVTVLSSQKGKPLLRGH